MQASSVVPVQVQSRYTLGDGGTLVGWPIMVFGFGLLLMIGLMVRKIKAALLIGIVVSTIVVNQENIVVVKQPNNIKLFSPILS